MSKRFDDNIIKMKAFEIWIDKEEQGISSTPEENRVEAIKWLRENLDSPKIYEEKQKVYY